MRPARPRRRGEALRRSRLADRAGGPLRRRCPRGLIRAFAAVRPIRSRAPRTCRLTAGRGTDTERSWLRSCGQRTLCRRTRHGGSVVEGVGPAGPAGLAQDLLDSIFRVATELVRGSRASLLVRDAATTDFVIAHAVGIAD